MKEREISVSDLFFDIVLRWRVIVVAMLIGAIVLGGLSYVLSYRRASFSGMDENVEVTQPGVETQLTTAELQNVIGLLTYEHLYEEKLAVMEQFLLMQMDSDVAQKAELTFMVSADDAMQAYSIEKIYEDALVSGEFLEKLSEEFQISNAVVSEIVKLERGSLEAIMGTDTFKISVVHYDKSICEQMTESIVSFVNEKCTEFRKTLGSHEIEVVNQSVAAITDMNALKYQKEYYQELTDLQSEIITLKGKLNSTEVEYYDWLTTMSEEEAGSDNTEGVESGINITPGISLKYVILGMILGLFVSVFWYFAAYIMNSKIRAVDNLQELYKIPQLGEVKATLVKKKLFGFVDEWIISLRDSNKRKFTKEEAISLAATAVKMAADKEALDTVYLVGCDLKGHTLELCEQIKAHLSNENLRLEILSNVLYDAQAMRDLEKVKGVVLLETIGSTLYSEIVQELELFYRQGISVLGGILVE